MTDVSAIRDLFVAPLPPLDERGRRSFAATEARSAGLADLADSAPTPAERNRRAGGGRKSLAMTDPAQLDDLLALVNPSERGDPVSPLRWTCKNLRHLAVDLRAMGHTIIQTVVGELLKAQKFSLQANRKICEGDSHPDRDAQFADISACVGRALAARQPMISVDTISRRTPAG